MPRNEDGGKLPSDGNISRYLKSEVRFIYKFFCYGIKQIYNGTVKFRGRLIVLLNR